jgi:feruloyl esterase
MQLELMRPDVRPAAAAHVRRTRWTATFVLGLLPLAVMAQGSASPSSDRCASLVGTRVESGAVTTARRFGKDQAFGGLMSSKSSADLCRVGLRLMPTPSSDINVDLWLPDAWNGKLLSVGGGGFSGGVAEGEPLMNARAREGYATASSDLGHPVSATVQWAHQQPERLVDFGHRANHLVAVAAKQVIAGHYGRPVQRAYFQGCSGGGREALMEAGRYPDDYDGVIAGAPAMDFAKVMSFQLWNARTLAMAPTLRAKLPVLHAAVLKACDKLDGVDDGVLENPLQCPFDPAQLQCKVFDTAACLTRNEVNAVRKVYEGPSLASGELLMPGLALGSEGAGWVIAGFFSRVGGPEFYRWMVYGDPAWDAEAFDLDRDYAHARAHVGPITDSGDADLAAFARRGGKVILYHGWSDPLIPAGNSLNYYDKLRARLGPALHDTARLYMAPGMPHCGAGIDLVPYLEAWIERGQPPDKVVVIQKPQGWLDSTATTRALCPWPKTAHYSGTGSLRDAANFSCR